VTDRIHGLHHITAIASDPQPTVDFYTGVLGLRLVKRTVNFDDPDSYHLYFGDAIGSPGTILTFFAWPGASRGRQGVGQAIAIGLAIPSTSLGYWIDRLIQRGIAFSGPDKRFGEQVLVLRDPDGLPIELITQPDPPAIVPWQESGIPPEHVIRGTHSATILVNASEPTADLLTETLGLDRLGEEDGRVRYQTGEHVPGSILDVRAASGFWPGVMSAGTIHHLAWRVPDDDAQSRWREVLEPLGLGVTPVLDRQYFHSIYFREPGDVLFEIATDAPGFATDEPVDALGSDLKLPAWLEPRRAAIERHLPPIQIRSGMQQESAAPALSFIHRFISANEVDRAPTLLLLHGTGGNEDDLVEIGRLLLPEAHLLSPRGRVTEHGMPRFFRRLAEGVFDRDDLVRQTDALAEFVAGAAQRYEFDPNHIVAVGYSNGANIAGSLLLLHPTVLAGAVLFRPMVPLEPDVVPDLTDVPVLLGSALRDELVSPEETERLSALLKGFGADVTVAWQPGGHALTEADLDTARTWIAERMPFGL
jgi:predicted esterase/catechol 2,3-dioxygenase-like lactoylglutathione lyase family enzyme